MLAEVNYKEKRAGLPRTSKVAPDLADAVTPSMNESVMRRSGRLSWRSQMAWYVDMDFEVKVSP
jgi:hypothetical protein